MLTVALAKTAVEKGCKYCPLTVAQIDQVIARYDEYQSTSLGAFVRAKC
jgi:hypothetical protein